MKLASAKLPDASPVGDPKPPKAVLRGDAGPGPEVTRGLPQQALLTVERKPPLPPAAAAVA